MQLHLRKFTFACLSENAQYEASCFDYLLTRWFTWDEREREK